MNPEIRPLFEAATRPYRRAGRYAWHFAKRKLRHDPVYFSLLRCGLMPEHGRLLDLGCGQGILLSLLEAARERYLAGAWPRDWPAPPLNLEMQGIEIREDRAQVAREVLGRGVNVVRGDVREAPFSPCSVIVILDVLLYLGDEDQRRLLERAAAVLDPGGVLLLREADAGAGLAFRVTEWSERIVGALRGRLWQPLHYRRAIEWIAMLSELGFAVEAELMSEGTPFANVLFVARKGSVSG